MSRTPRDIVARLRALPLERGQIAFAHLGQLGFLVRIGKAVAGCDLFLSPMKGRLVPPQLRPEDVADVDFLFGTHDHADHIDKPLWRELARIGAKARFIVPDSVRDGVIADTGLSPAQVIGMDAGQSRTVCGVRVSAFAAAHERLERDSSGRYKALGFVLAANGARICHSGDCCPYEGLQTTLGKLGPFTAMFLPINGRGNNMNAADAAKLARAFHVKHAVPVHYGMLDDCSPDAFVYEGKAVLEDGVEYEI